MAVKPRTTVPEGAAPVSELVATLPDGQKVKRRTRFMRACNEKDAKGRLCTGHLKRWYGYTEEVRNKFGDEIYRCEHCHALYLPAQDEPQRSGTLAF